MKRHLKPKLFLFPAALCLLTLRCNGFKEGFLYFAHGTAQDPFVLPDGTHLGITVCYEAIVPEFYLKVETRLPLIRVTNTGMSFTVDDRGRMSPTIGVDVEGVLHSTVRLPNIPPETFYVRYGDWFIAVCGALVFLLAGPLLVRKKNDRSLPTLQYSLWQRL